MLETITIHWRPAKKSSNALLKAGYSQAQLNDIGRQFIDRYLNQQVESPSTKFTNMVRSSGIGHNIQPPEDDALEKIQEAKAHKSENGEELAKETKECYEKHIMTQEEAIAWYKSRR